MKLIHTADIHLDSALCSMISGRFANQRRAELKEAFTDLLTAAKNENARIVIIAGDLFDVTPAPSTVKFLLSHISANPGIDFLYLPGNHDSDRKIFSAAHLPENFRIFGDGFSRFDYEGLSIGGIVGDMRTVRPEFDTKNKNILVLHGQLSDSASEADSICPRSYAELGIDYAALGHIHSYRSGRIDDRGIWCYSGCLAGRGFDECGEHGYVLLDTDSVTPGLGARFKPLPGRRLHDIPIDMEGIADVYTLLQRATELIFDIPCEDILRLTLVGRRSTELTEYVDFLTSNLKGKFAHFEVKDLSRRAISASDYMGDISVRGEYVRMVMADEALSDRDRELLLAVGLAALEGESPNISVD